MICVLISCVVTGLLSLGRCVTNLLPLMLVSVGGMRSLTVILLSLRLTLTLCVRTASPWLMLMFDRLLCGLGLAQLWVWVLVISVENGLWLLQWPKRQVSALEKTFLMVRTELLALIRLCRAETIGNLVLIAVLQWKCVLCVCRVLWTVVRCLCGLELVRPPGATMRTLVVS